MSDTAVIALVVVVLAGLALILNRKLRIKLFGRGSLSTGDDSLRITAGGKSKVKNISMTGEGALSAHASDGSEIEGVHKKNRRPRGCGAAGGAGRGDRGVRGAG